ncbi:MAG: hypothetical protein KDK36_16900 [Leptospiraceae bacterium]|nr:hypothetical protein [Leptospiraceae bacterium]
MNTSDRISARQIQLIQGAAKLLIDTLYLSKEDALGIITHSLKEELKASGVTFEYLELGSISNRQAFVRKLVYRVQKKLEEVGNISRDKINLAIEAFVKMFHESWRNVDK